MSSTTTMIPYHTSLVTANGSVVRHKLGFDMTITAGGEVTGFELADPTNKTLIWTGLANRVTIVWPEDGVRDVAFQYKMLLEHVGTFATIIHYARVEEYNSRYTAEITFADSDEAAMVIKHLAHHNLNFEAFQAFEVRIGVPHERLSAIAERFSELCTLAQRDNLIVDIQRTETNAAIRITGFIRLAVINMKRQLEELIEQSAVLDTTTIRAPKIQSERTCMACFDALERPVLPSCGHQSVFCAECLLETYRANHKKGPLRCTSQDDNGEICNCPLDLECLADNLPPALFEEFLDLAANAFACRNPNFVRHCPTPGCKQIYRPTPKTEGCMGSPKTCPDCLERVCTTCARLHDRDSSCESMIDRDLEQAKQELEARDCPECSTPIVRYDGCDKVECSGCGTFICWACMRTFTTSNAAYDHMVKDHGTVGEGYMLFDENGNPILNDEEWIENELAELEQLLDDEDNLGEEEHEEYYEDFEPAQDDGRDRGEGRMEVREQPPQQQQQPDITTGRPAAALENDAATQAMHFW
ncbi:ariadne ring [Colletotrichum kahawae]|uniref:Ariadne ring n=1 Tax=Colletotrichum kahawae TaxID=34407 RepID=A0AAD9YNQ3_COLKA|nr:ariadne ring [Colletotrichum kahawae]